MNISTLRLPLNVCWVLSLVKTSNTYFEALSMPPHLLLLSKTRAPLYLPNAGFVGISLKAIAHRACLLWTASSIRKISQLVSIWHSRWQMQWVLYSIIPHYNLCSWFNAYYQLCLILMSSIFGPIMTSVSCPSAMRSNVRSDLRYMNWGIISLTIISFNPHALILSFKHFVSIHLILSYACTTINLTWDYRLHVLLLVQ